MKNISVSILVAASLALVSCGTSTYSANGGGGYMNSIYYASSDTRMHVATSTLDRLVDYCLNTAPDGLRTGLSVEILNNLIDSNLNVSRCK